MKPPAIAPLCVSPEYPRSRKDFIARGLAARERAKSTGHYVSKEDLMASLRALRAGAR